MLLPQLQLITFATTGMQLVFGATLSFINATWFQYVSVFDIPVGYHSMFWVGLGPAFHRMECLRLGTHTTFCSVCASCVGLMHDQFSLILFFYLISINYAVFSPTLQIFKPRTYMATYISSKKSKVCCDHLT